MKYMVLSVNSTPYIFFLIVFLLIYWTLRKHIRVQNCSLLIASYLFYGLGDSGICIILFVSTIINYEMGCRIEKYDELSKRKRILRLSVIFNLTILGIFKYFNFFSDSISKLFFLFGISVSPLLLNLMLPVGISFFTFQLIAYNIEIYRKNTNATKDFITFASFIAFFPKLIAGPIESPKKFLPQLNQPKIFKWTKFTGAFQLMLMGYLKKRVIADFIAYNIIGFYETPQIYGSAESLIVAWLFSIQIYADFSGYTDIARGASLFLGIELMENFNQPYLSQNPQVFWRRWHISLSTWLTNYLYIPLGGNRKGYPRTLANIMMTMILGGLWHGAGINFIIWGFIHGLFLVIHRLILRITEKAHFDLNKARPLMRRFLKLVFCSITFQVITIAWIFFRAPTPDIAFAIINNIFTLIYIQLPVLNFSQIISLGTSFFFYLFLFTGSIMLIIDLAQIHWNTHEIFSQMRWITAGICYAGMIIMLLIVQITDYAPFIYQGF